MPVDAKKILLPGLMALLKCISARFNSVVGNVAFFMAIEKSLSLFMIHFVPDPPRAVAERYLITRPVGMVAVCSWDSTVGVELHTTFRPADTARDSSTEIPRS